jgi:hypothetical protein
MTSAVPTTPIRVRRAVAGAVQRTGPPPPPGGRGSDARPGEDVADRRVDRPDAGDRHLGVYEHGIARLVADQEVLLSASHPEVRRRGSGYSRGLGERFVARLGETAVRYLLSVDHAG